MTLVFVSYSHSDRAFVTQLAQDLSAREVPIWLDILNIKPGQRWDVEVERALERASHMLVVISPASMDSQNVHDEVNYAIDEGKSIIPILIADTKVPFRLRRLQYTDFREGYSAACEKLIKHLQQSFSEDLRTLDAPLVPSAEMVEAKPAKNLPLWNLDEVQLPDDTAALYMYDAKDGSNLYELRKNVILIGRGTECDIRLKAREISRFHLRITFDGDNYYLEDLESRNGTSLNGLPLKGKRKLADRDYLNVGGKVRLQFFGPASTFPMPLNDISGASNKTTFSDRLQLLDDKSMLIVNGKAVEAKLSPQQYMLLEMLYNAPGGVCSRAELLAADWGDGKMNPARLDNLVRRLQDRLSELDPDWRYITEFSGYGEGYVFTMSLEE